MSSPTASAAGTTSSRQTSDRRRCTPSDGLLNPRRIQTGLPGIRRTVYDGALRVNLDAYEVLLSTVAAVTNNSNSSVISNSPAANSALLQAKPEWRKRFPLNALLRPSTDESYHDQFNIPIATSNGNAIDKRKTIEITQLTNQYVTMTVPRIITNPAATATSATGEQQQQSTIMVNIDTVQTVAKNKFVSVLDAGLLSFEKNTNDNHETDEAMAMAAENGQDGSYIISGDYKEGVLSIRGGVGDYEEDFIMEGGGGNGEQQQSSGNGEDVHMTEAIPNEREEGLGMPESTVATASTTAAAAITVAVGGEESLKEAAAPAATTEAKSDDVAAVTQGEIIKDATTAASTEDQQLPPTTVTNAAASYSSTDDKAQEVVSNVIGQQQGGVADIPSSSSTREVVVTAAAVVEPTMTTSSSNANNNVAPPSVTTVKSTDIHPLSPDHQPLSTSFPTTNNTTSSSETITMHRPSWYNSTTISTIEKSSLPEWFNATAPHRTPSSYLSTRNHILEIYSNQATAAAAVSSGYTTTSGGGQHYLTLTAIRRVVPGDVGSLLRLHSFLCNWGLINVGQMGENAPMDLALRGGSVSSSNKNVGKRLFEEVKRSTFWSKDRLELLDGVVLKHVKSNNNVTSVSAEGAPQQQQQPSVDWDAVAAEIGESVCASDCQRAFLDPPKVDDVSAKITKTSSGGGLDLSNILDGVHPDVLNATINASLKATNDIVEARKASIAGVMASAAATKGYAEEEEIARTLMDIIDQRMQRLENRVAILDDVEALLEAERVALELERRDMYTTRCRHWFGDGSS